MPEKASKTPTENKIASTEADSKSLKSKAATDESKTLSKTTIFILMLAFGVHEFFDGIAFGLMESTETAVQLAVGIIIHKTCASLSLGAGLAKAGFSTLKIFVIIMCFSLSTPLGIIIGMNIAKASELLTMIFFQLSAGTFIYVACTEIITHEFES